MDPFRDMLLLGIAQPRISRVPPLPGGGRVPATPWGPSPPWSPGWPDWVWYLVAGVLALVVLLLLWFAVWRGRSRGRARCPRCWYDMSGSVAGDPSFTCPECGRSISRPRKLYRVRVRWVGLALACVCAVLCAASLMMPSIEKGGVRKYLPTRVLIAMMEFEPYVRTYSTVDTIEMDEARNRGFIRSELNLRRTSGAFSRADWRAYLAATRSLHPKVHRQHWVPTAYATMRYSPTRVRSFTDARIRARVVRIETDGERSPYPHPDFQRTLKDWVWLRVGDEIRISGREVGWPEAVPFTVLYEPDEPTERPHAGFYVANNVLAITFEVEVQRPAPPDADGLEEPISLGRMRVEFPPEYRDAELWSEVFPEAYEDAGEETP